MTGRRRRTCPRPAAPATLPDDDDILSEILLRLPPQPSSLPRASLVCKRWRRLVTAPHFRRSFRARHRNPPLIGFFDHFVRSSFFSSVLDPPDRIPGKRFSPPFRDDQGGCEPDKWRIYGCRHGRVLLYNRTQKEIVLWDPPPPPPPHRRPLPGCRSAGVRKRREDDLERCSALRCSRRPQPRARRFQTPAPSRWPWLVSPATTHKCSRPFTRLKQAIGAISFQ
ncbi:unnamed protein product [Urochloa humidicola]